MWKKQDRRTLLEERLLEGLRLPLPPTTDNKVPVHLAWFEVRDGVIKYEENRKRQRQFKPTFEILKEICEAIGNPVRDGLLEIRLFCDVNNRANFDKLTSIKFNNGNKDQSARSEIVMYDIATYMAQGKLIYRTFFPDPKTGWQIAILYVPGDYNKLASRGRMFTYYTTQSMAKRSQENQKQEQAANAAKPEEQSKVAPTDLFGAVETPRVDPALEEIILLSRLQSLLRAHPERVSRFLEEVNRVIEENRPTGTERILSAGEAAERIGVSELEVKRLLEAGRLGEKNARGKGRFSEQECDAYRENERKTEPRPEERETESWAKERLIGTPQAAEILGITPTRVQQHAQKGRIGELVGGRYLFSAEELEAFKHRVKPKGGRPGKDRGEDS